MTTHKSFTSNATRFALTSALAASLMASTAFAQDASVPYGAPKEDFIAALADMEPIELTMQSVSSPGTSSSQNTEAYAAALEDWSGGKITTNIVYGSAIMQGNTAPAVADGRISYGGVIAQYDPSNFPIGSALVDLSFLPTAAPFTGPLHSWGMLQETANFTEEAWQEQRDYGVEPGFLLNGTSPSGVFCREPRTTPEDFAGVQTRAGGLLHGKQVEGLGATAVALPYNEIFEGLQRGIIDCALTSIQVGVITGMIPVSPYHSVSPDVGFALTATNVAFDQVLWEEVPLAARQLMYDLQKVYIEQQILGYYATMAQGLEQFAEEGGEILRISPESEAMLRDTNDRLLEEARSNPYFNDPNDVVDRAIAANEKWHGILEDMGYFDEEPGYEGFAEWYAAGDFDIGPFVDRLYEETMLPFRPE